jgi:hypothetical protein
MHILDIDMDFFLDGRVTAAARDAPRPVADDHGLVPWSEDRVTNFLEKLNIQPGIKTHFVNHHDEVFPIWRRQIEESILKTPFHVVHVDAHSDLGMGFPDWPYLHTEFLKMSLKERHHPKTGNEGLNFGNYLLFAVGNRWISEIDFVANSSWRDDLPRLVLGR